MAQIGLDGDSILGGVVPAYDHCADVSGPGAGYILPPMMARKFIGEASAKVVCLADIYRIPAAVRGLAAEDVDAADRIERDVPEREVLEFIRRAAKAPPHKARGGVD